MSLTVIFTADLPLFNVNVIISVSSVVLSAVAVYVKVAVLLLITKLPVKLAFPISEVRTPVIVYGTVVLSVTLVVVNVIVKVSPSSTAFLFVDRM